MTAVDHAEAPMRAATARWGLSEARRLILISLVPFLALVAVHWSLLPLLRAGDYAQYLLHAQALIDGRPYAETGYIFTPSSYFVGPRVQPPGLPLTLVPVLALFGRNWVVLKLVMVVSGALFLYLAGRDLSRRVDPRIAAGAILISGVALEASYATNAILTDLGFCALLWALIHIADAPGAWTMRRIAAVTGLGLFAMSYRVAGVALVPATALFALFRWRTLGLRPVVPIVVWGALGIGAVFGLGLAAQFPLSALAPAHIVGRIVDNVYKARFALAEAQLYPFPWNRANDVYHVVALGLAAVGAVVVVRRLLGTYLLAFIAAYGAMLLMAPVTEPRYWWPLFPVLNACSLQGMVSLIQRAPLVRQWAPPRLALGTAVILSICAATMIARRPRPVTLLDQPDVRALFSFVRERGRAEPMRLYFMNPRVLTWETGVPAMPYIEAPTDTLLRELRGRRISHVVAGDLRTVRRANDSLSVMIGRRPELFREEYRNSSFRLFRLLGDSARARTDSAAGKPNGRGE